VQRQRVARQGQSVDARQELAQHSLHPRAIDVFRVAEPVGHRRGGAPNGAREIGQRGLMIHMFVRHVAMGDIGGVQAGASVEVKVIVGGRLAQRGIHEQAVRPPVGIRTAH